MFKLSLETIRLESDLKADQLSLSVCFIKRNDLYFIALCDDSKVRILLYKL